MPERGVRLLPLHEIQITRSLKLWPKKIALPYADDKRCYQFSNFSLSYENHNLPIFILSSMQYLWALNYTSVKV